MPVTASGLRFRRFVKGPKYDEYTMGLLRSLSRFDSKFKEYYENSFTMYTI